MSNNKNGNKSGAEKALYNICVSSNKGKVRENNEDNFAINTIFRAPDKCNVNFKGSNADEPIMCTVFDGMGGEAMGEESSAICAQTAKKLFEVMKKYSLPVDKAFDAFATDCNNKIVDMLDEKNLSRGGSTFVMAYMTQGKVHTASMGDSRIYLLKGDKLEQLTKDHTLAMKKYNANIYTLEEALASPDNHKLTAYLGVDDEFQGLKPEKYEALTLDKGDKLLLCSDGLYDMVSDSDIKEILKKDSDTVSYDLVKAALGAGGVDNVTCMVVERV